LRGSLSLRWKRPPRNDLTHTALAYNACMSSKNDVLILGAGVIGLACALQLLREGAQVTVIEQTAPGAGASHGNCGTITPSHAPPLTAPGVVLRALRSLLRADAPLRISPMPDLARWRWLFGLARQTRPAAFWHAAQARAALLQRARELLPQMLAREGIDAGWSEQGLLLVFRDARALAAEQHDVEVLQRLRIPVRVLQGAEVEAREPALRPGVAGAIEHTGDAMLRPERLVAGLAARVQALGGVIESGARIEGFDTGAARITTVHTTRGGFRAAQVLLALGAWSPLLARRLGLRIPVQPGKGYSMTWDAQPGAPRTPLVLKERSVCVTAWQDGFRLGSTMEFSGWSGGLNPVRLAALQRAAGEYLHAPPRTPAREQWWGWRPMSRDEVPLIGPSTRWRNLWLATGHGMLGVSMAAATAELIAQLLDARAPTLDAALYAPARFGL
jgi:D-amino-acid dehydrogenase